MFQLLMSMEKATRILTSQIPTNIPGLVSDHTRIKSKNHQASAARQHVQIPQKTRKFNHWTPKQNVWMPSLKHDMFSFGCHI